MFSPVRVAYANLLTRLRVDELAVDCALASGAISVRCWEDLVQWLLPDVGTTSQVENSI